MPKTVKIDVSPYVAKLLTIEASYQEISRIELANKILLDAISQKTKIMLDQKMIGEHKWFSIMNTFDHYAGRPPSL